jgi:ATP-dependent DNA ligase
MTRYVAFDLLELNGKDLGRQPLESRKRALARLLRGAQAGNALNFYQHACSLGCEGIVSKRLGSPYRDGRADCWLKVASASGTGTAPTTEVVPLGGTEWRLGFWVRLRRQSLLVCVRSIDLIVVSFTPRRGPGPVRAGERGSGSLPCRLIRD